MADSSRTKGESLEKSRFKYCFDSYYPQLSIFAFRFVKDMEVATDLTQDAFVKCWNQFNDFENETIVRMFLYTALKNLSINYLKRRRIENSYLATITPEIYKTEQMLESEVYSHLEIVIQKLPPQSKRIIELSLEGKKNREIADILNVSINTIKTLKQIAYKMIRERMKNLAFILLTLTRRVTTETLNLLTEKKYMELCVKFPVQKISESGF
ncbi:MAG: sigma-70 family RNA polymerase sigma factor [Bacillota bacterium]